MVEEKEKQKRPLPDSQGAGGAYEQAVPDDATEPGHNKKRKQRNPHSLWFRAAILLAVVALFFAVITGGSFSLDAVTGWIQTTVFGEPSGDGYPVALPGTKLDAGNFALAGNHIAMVTDTAFTVLNSSGAAQTSLQHGYNTPVLKVGSGAYLIYDLGGKRFRVVSDKAVLHEKTLDTQIFTGAISRSGLVAIAAASKNYCTEVVVYSSAYQKVFSWSSPLYRVTSLALDGNGSRMVAAGVTAENGQLKSAVYVFDLTKETPEAVFEFPDTVIFSVSYLDGGAIAVVGDQSASVVSAGLQQKTDYSYAGATLHGYSVAADAGIALLLSDYEDGRNCRLIALDRGCAETVRQPLAGNATSVFYSGRGILALSGGTLSHFDSSGALRGTYPAGLDVKNAVFTGNAAYLLGISEIRQVSLGQ